MLKSNDYEIVAIASQIKIAQTGSGKIGGFDFDSENCVATCLEKVLKALFSKENMSSYRCWAYTVYLYKSLTIKYGVFALQCKHISKHDNRLGSQRLKHNIMFSMST